MSARLLGAFGALALLLAAVGVHCVVSYSVAERTQEFGIEQFRIVVNRNGLSVNYQGPYRTTCYPAAF